MSIILLQTLFSPIYFRESSAKYQKNVFRLAVDGDTVIILINLSLIICLTVINATKYSNATI
jgi:hypothetical protein